jgi:hypothetical protein
MSCAITYIVCRQFLLYISRFLSEIAFVYHVWASNGIENNF